jgi:L-lactate dehydrogenase complex protein LldF
MWSWVIRSRTVYDFFLRMAAIGQKFFPASNGMIRRLPSPMNGWTRDRDIHPLANETFMQRWKKGDFS